MDVQSILKDTSVKATYQEMIEEARKLASSSNQTPGSIFSAVMAALGENLSAAVVDRAWADFYQGEAQAKILALEAEVESLKAALVNYETSF
jgi:hypothetical protein